MKPKPTRQHYSSERFGNAVFIDRLEQGAHTRPAHPRDIEVLVGDQDPRLLEEIAIDIRRGQGMPEIGIAKNLQHALPIEES